MNTKTVKAHSHIQVENYKMVWNLYNFNKLPFLNNHPIYGPKFTMGSKARSRWTIMVSKEDIEEEKSMGFRLTKEIKNFCWEIVKFSVTIKSKNGLSQTCLTDVVTSGNVEFPFYYIMLSNLSPENKNIFNSEDLTIECSMEYMYHKEHRDVLEPFPEDKLMVEDLKCLHDCKAYSDITLVVKEGNTEFACHKSILCTRSYRFNLDCQNLGEDSRLELNLEKETAKAMIWYIYTSEMPHKFSVDNYVKLCRAAAFYNISHLAKLCNDFLSAKGNISCLCPKCNNEEVTSDDESDGDE